MSRTYRRKKEPIRIKRFCDFPWNYRSGIWVMSGYGYDKQNSLYLSLDSQEDAESPWAKRSIAKHFSDAGTRKKFRNLKHILKNRYRVQCKEKLHHSLKKEDDELQLYTFTKFDVGIWWD